MKWCLFISAVCMQLSWCFGAPGSQGVGAYAYQDSTGNRYGGTYGLRDGELYGDVPKGGPVPFAPNFQDPDDFFPEYFRNFENLLQEAFQNQLTQQRLALNAARKAYDLTFNQAAYQPAYQPSYQAGYNSNFASRYPGFPGWSGFPGFQMPNFEPFPMPNMPNSAFAGAAAGPGYNQHTIALNPSNPQKPNIDVTNFADMPAPGRPQMYSVSSSSFSSSSNLNGQVTSKKGGETIVNDNGKITKYSIDN